MFQRIKLLWGTVRDSLWFIPSILTVLAVVAAFIAVMLDYHFAAALSESNFWFLGGGAEGARLVLSTIAGSLITVTGVVFSVTIVALQLASSQFAPRILRNFMADRSDQLVLGVLISTFTYTLLVLRVVRSASEGGPAFVPHIAIWVAILLALVSVGFLIHFIHHAARSIQASVILANVTREALQCVVEMFPDEIGEPTNGREGEMEIPPRPATPVDCHRSGYLQAVDGHSLFDLGEKHHMLIRMKVPIGAFVVEGQTLVDVWSDEVCDEQVNGAIRNAFLIGEQRTPDQDAEFGMLQISDMAVKALSPGINDPTTAMHSIDRLTQILLTMGKRRPPEPLRTEDGQVHFLALPATLESSLRVSFEQIHHYGRNTPSIVKKLQWATETLQRLLPDERRATVRHFAEMLQMKDEAARELAEK